MKQMTKNSGCHHLNRHEEKVDAVTPSILEAILLQGSTQSQPAGHNTLQFRFHWHHSFDLLS
eukprot:scaffold133_cov169-Amphora_coffeaeformis.AAC.11